MSTERVLTSKPVASRRAVKVKGSRGGDPREARTSSILSAQPAPAQNESSCAEAGPEVRGRARGGPSVARRTRGRRRRGRSSPPMGAAPRGDVRPTTREGHRSQGREDISASVRRCLSAEEVVISPSWGVSARGRPARPPRGGRWREPSAKPPWGARLAASPARAAARGRAR